MEKGRKSWLKPRMTVLIRQEPQERVCAVCKSPSKNQGPGQSDGDCKVYPPIGAIYQCFDYGAS